MTARVIFLLIFGAAAFGLGVLWMRKPPRRARRARRPRPDERAAAYREGVRAEAARWEKVAGVPFERLQSWRTGRGPDPFANLGAETEVLPSFGKVMADADAFMSKPRMLSVAEADEWAGQWAAAHAPLVADITNAARRRFPGTSYVQTVDGIVVTPGRDQGNGWDRAAALPDYAAAALGGHRTVDECVDSIVMRAVNP